MAGDLSRFVEAQAGAYATALRELRDGEKRTHWMWFVFPQLRGLGRSEMAHRYGIAGLGEARAYLDHPLLGARLEECTRAMLAHAGTPASRDKSPRGQCRRYAPPVHLIGASEPDVGGTRKPLWAIVAKDDWCGEFVQRDYKSSF